MRLRIVMRWVDEDYEIHEEPLLIQVPKTDSETLTNAIKDVLIRCMLPLSQCRGQAYDGASNMSGRLKANKVSAASSNTCSLFSTLLEFMPSRCCQNLP